jgi:acylglycerol lipase
MKHFETKWKAHDTVEIFGQGWEPDAQPPRAVVCLVHGLGEHSSRYGHVADAFTQRGYVLFTCDLRGHGHSAGPRGHINSIEDFMKDIDSLFQQARERYAGLPMILYGHSLGGILVLHYTLKRKPAVKGVIATSPGLHNELEKQPLKVMAAKVLGAVIPGLAIPSGLDPRSISRDEKVVDVYINDPLVHDRVSLGFGRVMLGVNQWTLEHAAEFPSPLLLLHGRADALAFSSSSTEFAAALKGNGTLVLWDDGYHELHNDLEQTEVFKTMTTWMDARLRE